MNDQPTPNPSTTRKSICPSCGKAAASWRVLPISTLKLRSLAFVLLGIGVILTAGCGIAYLVAESHEGGSTRPTVTTGVSATSPAGPDSTTPGVTGPASRLDSTTVASTARRNSVLGMVLGGGFLFVGSVMIFSRKKTLVCPECHAHSAEAGTVENPVEKQAVRNSERRDL